MKIVLCGGEPSDCWNSIGNKVYAFSLFFFLVGTYLLPEHIKIFAIIYVLAMAFCILCTMRIEITPTTCGWCLFAGLGLLSCMIHGSRNLLDAVKFVVSIMMGLMMLSVFTSKKARVNALYAVFAVGMVVMLGCTLQLVAPELLVKINSITLGESKFLIFSDFYSWGGLVGFSYQTGVTGYYLGILLGFVLCVLFFDEHLRKSQKLALVIASVVIVAFILLTAKRSVLLIAAVLTYALLCYRNKKSLMKIVSMTVLFFVCASVLLCCTGAGRALIKRTMGSNPLSGRVEIYSQMIELIKQKPIFGHGFGSTLAYIQRFRNGHNIYLQVLMENGIVGLLILGAVFVYHLLFTYRTLRKHGPGERCSVAISLYIQLFFLGIGFFGNPLYDVFPLIIYMAAVGVVYTQNTGEKDYAREMDCGSDI